MLDAWLEFDMVIAAKSGDADVANAGVVVTDFRAVDVEAEFCVADEADDSVGVFGPFDRYRSRWAEQRTRV